MKKTTAVYVVTLASALCAGRVMASPDALRVELASNTGHGRELLAANASCVRSATAGSAPGANKSLAVKWSDGPAGTRSYALTMVDLDVPADLSTLNKAGTVIASDAPRMEFVHWVLADIPKGVAALPEGADGNGLPQGGLPLERTSHGLRGQNGFAAFMKDGPYGGYMGPCPPWNDKRVHRYFVTVYALDVDSLGVSGAFTRADLLNSSQGHILATGRAEVDYSVNSAAKH